MTEARAIPGVRKILAVASAKGGVGKTTVAVNLALTLRRMGKRVGLFDADLYGPNVPLMLGVRVETASFPMTGTRQGKTTMGLIPIARTDSTPYIPPLKKFGLKVMSLGLWYAESGLVVDTARLGAQIIVQTLGDVLWDGLDILVMDLPPGTGDFHEELIRQVSVDGVVLVTTPQDMAILDTGRSLRLFQKAGIPVLGYVENMCSMTCPRCGHEMEIFTMTRRDLGSLLDIPSLARIPLDTALSRPIDADHPLTQATLDTPDARIFRGLAEMVLSRMDG